MTLPLHGRTVAVTSSGGAELAALLRARGATVLEVPLIRFFPPASPDKLRQALQAQPCPDWLLLTSGQAVKAISAFLPELTDVKVAAVGASTARLLSAQSRAVDFVPSRSAARFLGAELPARPGHLALHPTSQVAESDLQNTLAARGIGYCRVEAYRTGTAELSAGQLRQLLEAEVVTLASGSAAQQLSALGGTGLRVVAMGQQTASAARAAGFSRVRVAPEATVAGLAAAVEDALLAQD